MTYVLSAIFPTADDVPYQVFYDRRIPHTLFDVQDDRSAVRIARDVAAREGDLEVRRIEEKDGVRVLVRVGTFETEAVVPS